MIIKLYKMSCQRKLWELILILILNKLHNVILNNTSSTSHTNNGLENRLIFFSSNKTYKSIKKHQDSHTEQQKTTKNVK